MKEISLAAKEWQIKGTKQLNELNSEITLTNEKFVGSEKKIKNNNDGIKSFRKETSYLPKRHEEMEAVLRTRQDRQELLTSDNILPFDSLS